MNSNFLENLPQNIKDEIFEDIISSSNINIERIISNGQSSPDDFWYDQEQNEWVILLQGSAGLKFEDEEIIILKPFDYLLIPAHKKHRVEWTVKDETTIWLAVHF